MTVALELAHLRTFVVLALGAGAGLFALLSVRLRLQVLQRQLRAHAAAVASDVSFLRLGMTARQVLLVQAGLLGGGVVALVLALPLIASIFVVPALSIKPLLEARRARRVAAIEELLDGWLSGLALTLRATPSLGESLAYSAEVAASPLREELDTLLKEQRLGTPLDEALVRMGERIGSRTVQSALGTLRIGQRTGGDVAATLERSASTLRELARLEGVVRVRTAEGRAQASVLALLPFPVVALLNYLDPGFLSPLLTSSRGHLVIAGSAVLWLASLLIAKRVLRVDI